MLHFFFEMVITDIFSIWDYISPFSNKMVQISRLKYNQHLNNRLKYFLIQLNI
jgi:hypothetical protein